MNKVTKDLTGQRFGRLVAIEVVGKSNSHGVLWRCKCDCGNEKITRSNYLIAGQTTSCGCYRSELSSKFMSRSAEWNTRHGMAHTPLFNQWCSMRRRCTDPKNRMYHRYGGRGIRFCKEWEQFEPFKEWALAHGWKEHLALDRIDNDGDYCPENCRWVTQRENNRNKPNLIYLTIDGERKLLVDWADETGQPRWRLYYRRNCGWSDREIVFGKGA